METIHIMEVGPRDGLQNTQQILNLDQKKALIQFLLDNGIQDMEAGAFVRADKVPAMQDSDKLAAHFKNQHQNLWYLAPNLKGLKTALDHKVTQIALFTAASQKFNQKNIGMGVNESMDIIHNCIEYLRDENYHILTDWNKRPQNDREIKLRLYISTVIGCPYEGKIAPRKTVAIMEELMHLGIAQVSLGDTIGVGVPNDWKRLFAEIDKKHFEKNQIAMHCHNTYGTALSCVAYGLEAGIRNFDSSIGGLGGCPYAPGASGNLATEDLLYFLDKQGLKTGLDLEALLEAFDPKRTGDLTNTSSVYRALT